MTPFGQSKPPSDLGRARHESVPALSPPRAGDGLVSGHRVNLLERYDDPQTGTESPGSSPPENDADVNGIDAPSARTRQQLG